MPEAASAALAARHGARGVRVVLLGGGRRGAKIHIMLPDESAAMKIRLEMEVDLATGIYDVRFQNISHPGEDIDLGRLAKVVGRVLDNVAYKTAEVRQATPSSKLRMN